MRLRPLAFGLATLLGIRKLGWFIPYRYAVCIADRAEKQHPGTLIAREGMRLHP